MLRGQLRTLEGYGEVHHIIPKCLGGSDDPSNLVKLTAEEHYVAHQLLVKIYPGNSRLTFAALCMSSNPHGHRNNNKLYGWIRKAVSESMKGKPGNTLGIKRGPPSEETRAKQSAALKGRPGVSRRRTEKSKTKQSRTMTGSKRPEEVRAKISASKRGVPRPPEVMARAVVTKQTNALIRIVIVYAHMQGLQ